MKKVKNNLWNKIFHKKALNEYKQWKKVAEAILGWYKQLDEDLRRATTLQSLINIHKKAWEIGYQSLGLAPCPWGMFRCKDISELTLDNLYLGDIWGLWTNSGKFWEENKSETMAGNGFGIPEDKLVYDIIVGQYKNHLRTNFEIIRRTTADEILGK